MLWLILFAAAAVALGEPDPRLHGLLSGLSLATSVVNVKVIWLADPTNPKNAVEGDWISRVVLRDTPHTTIVDSALQTFENNALIIFSSSSPTSLAPIRTYLQEYCRRKLTFSVYHLSDEFYQSDPTRTLYTCAKIAFRNYFLDLYQTQPNVLSLPLGFTDGAYRTSDVVLPTSERELVWTFIGQISRKPSREAMRDALLTVNNTAFFTHETNTWGRFDPRSLNATQMGAVLAKTVFCPSPRGWWNKVRCLIYNENLHSHPCGNQNKSQQIMHSSTTHSTTVRRNSY